MLGCFATAHAAHAQTPVSDKPPVSASAPTSSAAPSPAAPPPEGPPSPTAPTPPPPPPPAGPTPAEEALKAEQAELKAQLETLDAILGAEREQRAEEVVLLRDKLEKAEAALKKPPVSAAKSGVGLTGYVQADWTAWHQSAEDQLNQSTNLPINDERFNIRRARLKATIDRQYTAGALEFDGNTSNGTTARIVNAEASAKLPGEEGAAVPLAMVSIGLFKIPFGYEVVQSDRDRLFLERSKTEQALFPGEYDLGARLQGGWLFLRYALAVQNGDPLGEKAFPGRDPNAAKDITLRVGVDTPITDNVSISAGASYLKGKGFHAGTAATKPTIQWSDRDENGVFSPSEIVQTTGSAASPSVNFDRFALGFDLKLALTIPTVGVATVYGELYQAKNLDRAVLPADPIAIGRDYRELGAYVAGTFDFNDLGSLGFRYDAYNPDRDSTDPAMPRVLSNESYGSFAFVAALGTTAARLVVEYDHNINHNGRDAEGRPTLLKDDTLIARGQVAF
ncbi:MAG TPA: hypothetical protein VHJ20_03045 [Polyangia bacterium]|nr:hypothetical protein [Polyangia bacterium]